MLLRKFSACVLMTVLFGHPLFAQDTLAISIVDFYGTRTVAESSIREVLGVKAGQSLRVDSTTVEELKKRLTTVPGVRRSEVTFTCCDAKEGKWIIFAGVSEQDKDEFSYNPVPTGS